MDLLALRRMAEQFDESAKTDARFADDAGSFPGIFRAHVQTNPNRPVGWKVRNVDLELIEAPGLGAFAGQIFAEGGGGFGAGREQSHSKAFAPDVVAESEAEDGTAHHHLVIAAQDGELAEIRDRSAVLH